VRGGKLLFRIFAVQLQSFAKRFLLLDGHLQRRDLFLLLHDYFLRDEIGRLVERNKNIPVNYLELTNFLLNLIRIGVG
jgi:hypothetical protein